MKILCEDKRLSFLSLAEEKKREKGYFRHVMQSVRIRRCDFTAATRWTGQSSGGIAREICEATEYTICFASFEGRIAAVTGSFGAARRRSVQLLNPGIMSAESCARTAVAGEEIYRN